MSITAGDGGIDLYDDASEHEPGKQDEDEDENHEQDEEENLVRDRDQDEGEYDHYEKDVDHSSLVPPLARKRQRGSCPSSAVIPAAIKRQIIDRANKKCWLCGQFGKHVAHVIAKADTILFEDYKRSGLLNMPSLHSVENLVYLCAGCHGDFHERVPVWTFLPLNLDSFLLAEEDFQNRRVAAAALGQTLHRSLAPIESIPYARYQIRRGHIFTQVFKKKRVKHWGGNPIAAIIRSASILSGMQRLDPEKRCGIPAAVALTYQRLLHLYGTPPPKLAGVPDDDDDDADSLLGGGHDEHPDGLDDSNVEAPTLGEHQHPQAPEPKPAGRHLPRTQAAPARKAHQSRSNVAAPPKLPTLPHKRRACEDDDCIPESQWRFGPHMTSDMLITWCRSMDDD